ncbi:hypothetical protein AVEN_87337-1 [Araneus ventricosus]|uniref:Uncharacterized protein n=1 Tax=Araneus ventricosus TaxID=182803 RepID=A0A4Y2HDZ4_ARAVE|nr:hypothetical protein AVEN_87337-1 [Araneus ventricosus]
MPNPFLQFHFAETFIHLAPETNGREMGRRQKPRSCPEWAALKIGERVPSSGIKCKKNDPSVNEPRSSHSEMSPKSLPGLDLGSSKRLERN